MSVKESLRELDDVLTDMEEYEKLTPRPRIGERAFRKIHLPRFWYHGQIHPESKKEVKVNLSDWVFNVAGGLFNEVDVIDDVTGEVLFVVPPLIPQVGVSVGNVIYEVADSREKIPSSALINDAVNLIRGQKDIKRATRDIDSISDMYLKGMSQTDREKMLESHYARWDIIFDRYVPDRKKSKASNLPQQADNTDYEDDDEPLY